MNWGMHLLYVKRNLMTLLKPWGTMSYAMALRPPVGYWGLEESGAMNASGAPSVWRSRKVDHGAGFAVAIQSVCESTSFQCALHVTMCMHWV